MSDIITPEVKEQKPVISQVYDYSNVRFVVLTSGQGGASIGAAATAYLPNNPFMIATNTSEQDLKQLNLPDEQKFKIGGPTITGAGKNRNRAKAYFKNFVATNKNTGKELSLIETLIGYYEEVLFHPTKQTIIVVPFSSDGGTGSGMGVMLTANLSNYVNSVKSFHFDGKDYEIDDVLNTVPRPVVVGLTPKCDTNSEDANFGATNLQNTIGCFMDIQSAINANLGHFFIADNTLQADVKYTSTEEKYKIINARIVAPLIKFLGIEMNSDIKCMDLQDKINCLRISGCSSFTSLTEKNKYQYVVPRGQSVIRTVLMLNSKKDLPAEEKLAKQMIKNFNITSLDTTPVFFDVEKSGIVDNIPQELMSDSMIAFFGFKSLGAIVEDLRDHLHRIQTVNDKKAIDIEANATGFSTFEEDNKELEKRFGSSIIDQKSVNDLF